MSVGAGPAPGPAQPVERARGRPGQVHAPHDRAGLEGVVGVDVHDPQGQDPRDLLAGPGPADVQGHAGLAGPSASQRAHPHRDEGGEVGPRDPGRLRDVAVLLGHRRGAPAPRAPPSPLPVRPRRRGRAPAGPGRSPRPGRTPAAPRGAPPAGGPPAGRPTGRPRAARSPPHVAPGREQVGEREPHARHLGRRLEGRRVLAHRGVRVSPIERGLGQAHPSLGGLQLERREPPAHEGVVRGHGLRAAVEAHGARPGRPRRKATEPAPTSAGTSSGRLASTAAKAEAASSSRPARSRA